MESIVVIGAGHAGVEFVAALRDGGYGGALTLVAEEAVLPYQRPSLSKDHLDESPTPPLPLRGEPFYRDNAVDLLGGVTATGIDRQRHEVTLSDGHVLPYSTLVLATGARARRLPGVESTHAGAHEIRTLADADQLREALVTARRAVVLGAGFLGLEVAAAARKRGVEVTVLEAGPSVLGRTVSSTMAAHIAAAHQAAGTEVVLGESASAFDVRAGTVVAVVGASGRVHPADLVLVAVGATPRDDLARRAGLAVGDGILVDERLRTSDPDILAIGDCARLARPAPGSPGRLECVQNAVDQARHAARDVLGTAGPFAAVPWFWSYQGSLRLQIAGVGAPDDVSVTVGDVASGKFSVFCFRDGRLRCVESMNRPADHLAARRLLDGDRLPTPSEVAEPDFQLKKFAAGLTAVPS